MAQFTPEGYVEHGRIKLIEATSDAAFGPTRRFARPVNWSHPAYANGHIVHRNDNEIIPRVAARGGLPVTWLGAGRTAAIPETDTVVA